MSDEKKLVAKIEADSSGLRKELDRATADIKGGAKAWEDAAGKSVTGINKVRGAIKVMGEAVRHPVQAAKELGRAFAHPVEAVRRLRDAINETARATQTMEGAGKQTQKTFEQMGQKLLGMGGKVAIIIKAIKVMADVFKVGVLDRLEKANEEMRKFVQWQSGANISTMEKNIQKMEAMEADLKKYAEAVEKARASGSAVDRTEMLRQRRDVNYKYGLSFNDANFESVMAQEFRRSRNWRADALEGEIRQLERVNKALGAEKKEKEGYFSGGYWRRGAGGDEEQWKRVEEISREMAANADKISDLQERLRLVRGEDNLGDWRRARAAQAMDAEERARKELASAMEAKARQYRDAYGRYMATEREVEDARRSYASAQRALASEAISARREGLRKQMRAFGFAPYEGFDLGESRASRRRRRRNARLDADIAAKMARSEEGRRVHWTGRERRRINEYLRLDRQDKQLEAAQRQMSAADKQQRAAETLMQGANALRAAVSGRASAFKALTEAGGALTARGAAGLGGMTPQDYRALLGQIHGDLQAMRRNVYIVK